LLRGEADLAVTRFDQDTDVTVTQQTTAHRLITFDVTEHGRLEWFGTARNRIGYVPPQMWNLPPILIYGTGGLAFGQVRSSLNGVLSISGPGFDNATPISLTGSESKIRTGWTAGGGAEVKYGRNSFK